MSYKFDSIVNRSEVNALKEMIFNRAKEKNQGMQESVQSDIMDLARESFVSRNNPFSQILKENKPEIDTVEISTPAVKTETVSETGITEEEPEIGFAQRQFAPRAVAQNKIINNEISASTIYNNMTEAREGLTRKRGFMGALEFLNTQAAVSLARVNRADRFEMIV